MTKLDKLKEQIEIRLEYALTPELNEDDKIRAVNGISDLLDQARALGREEMLEEMKTFWHEKYGMDMNGVEYVIKKDFDEFLESYIK